MRLLASEQLFRWCFVAIFISTVSISSYFRRKARRSGEAIPRAREGKLVLLTRLVFAALLCLPIFAYMLNPAWMAWSAMPLPSWLRWLGAAVGLGSLLLLYWVVSSIGNNISETFLTKEKHVLVTHGPYRWVRHPLYAAAMLAFGSLSILAANGFMLAMVCVAFLGIAALVVPREEAELIRKFGDAYRAYMLRAGRFTPRVRFGMWLKENPGK
jgi:protein-S-isoprenylcysteine O-methyltransferase Ste14